MRCCPTPSGAPPTTRWARAAGQGEPFTPPPDWDAGFEFSGPGAEGMEAGDFSDFFAELFGRAGGGTRRRAAGARFEMRGEDHHAKIVLDLEDAWRGATRQVTLRSPQVDAQGHVSLQPRTLDVQDPAGVKPGQLIRLAGQGGAGHGGAPAGDLFLEVHFKPHPRFRIDGAHLVSDLPVAPWEAALGAVVPVELPDGIDAQGARACRRAERPPAERARQGLARRHAGRPGTAGARRAAQRLRPAGAQAVRDRWRRS